MAHLFTIEDDTVYPNPETLLISPYKEIWRRDKNRNKKTAIREFTFIEFMASMKKTNPYKGYELDAREAVLRQDIFKGEPWEKDKLVSEGIAKLEEFQTLASQTYRYYMANRVAAEKMLVFFTTVDVNERTKNDTPVYKPKEITSAISDCETVLTKLKALEQKVEEELFESTKTRSNKEVGAFEE